MEATKEDAGFLEKIRPPRLEDAGLEDCALPPDSIKEAFLRAATAVSSRVGSLLSDSDGACVSGSPTPPSDALVGAEPAGGVPDSCAAKKGGALVGEDELGADLVLGGSPAGREDAIVAPPVEESDGGGAACVDGLSGLEVGEEEEEGDEGGGEGPTLVEGYVV